MALSDTQILSSSFSGGASDDDSGSSGTRSSSVQRETERCGSHSERLAGFGASCGAGGLLQPQDIVQKDLVQTSPLPIGSGMKNKHPGRGAAATTIVVAVPVALKSLVKPMGELTRTVAARVERAQRGGEAVDYQAWAQEVAMLTAAVTVAECASHACTLGAMEVDAPRVEMAGEIHARGPADRRQGPEGPGAARVRLLERPDSTPLHR